ncbi:cell division/environmental response transcriptional regulator [Gordonia jinhuaensis]|uniref:DNA-binding protein n=1 Tax=Gordonia jinhuaensis TaxID=1517702 RepID=A0A916SX51_9ACTN|nr:helix-turn-helix domain-containing protein [Gordonia jinhuaensis]GGB21434.1 DNA-binding protein [Gordonia jinhuaensis]
MAPASKPGEIGPADAGSQFLTVAEVAALMRVSKMTVYRLVHSGELPAVRVGRSFRVPAKAVHDYLETSYFDVG